jgi:hypothetical protein
MDKIGIRKVENELKFLGNKTKNSIFFEINFSLKNPLNHS